MLQRLISNDEIKAKSIQVFTASGEIQLVKKIKVKKGDVNWLSCLTLCLLSKKLYNVGLYEVRQQYIENKTWLNYETLANKLKSHVNFKYLPAKVSQQILKLLSQNVASFIALTKSEKLTAEQKKKHKLPKYYGKGQLAPVIFTRQSLSKLDFEKVLKALKSENPNLNLALNFSGCDKTFYLDLIKEKIYPTIQHFNQINQVRIIPAKTIKKDFGEFKHTFSQYLTDFQAFDKNSVTYPRKPIELLTFEDKKNSIETTYLSEWYQGDFEIEIVYTQKLQQLNNNTLDFVEETLEKTELIKLDKPKEVKQIQYIEKEIEITTEKTQVNPKTREIETKITTRLKKVKEKIETKVWVSEIEKKTKAKTQNLYLKEAFFQQNWSSIDLNLNCLAVAVNINGVIQSYLWNLKPIKSVNHFWNKKVSQLKSEIDKLRNELEDLEKEKDSQNKEEKEGKIELIKIKIKKLKNQARKQTTYRNNYIENFVHQLSRKLITQLHSLNVRNVIFGKNINFKQEINLGKRLNQQFVQIPFNKIIDKICYKAQLSGMNFILTEESYTSKTSFLDKELLLSYKDKDKDVNKNHTFLGKRISRSLFQTQNGKIIHADINGALNIARKVMGETIYQVVNVNCPSIMGSSPKVMKVSLGTPKLKLLGI